MKNRYGTGDKCRRSISLDPGIEPGSSALKAYSLPSESPGKPCYYFSYFLKFRKITKIIRGLLDYLYQKKIYADLTSLFHVSMEAIEHIYRKWLWSQGK